MVKKRKVKTKKRVKMLFVSGFNFPSRSRPYLPRLVKEVAIRRKAGAIFVAGNMLDGKALEASLKQRQQEIIAEERFIENERKGKIAELKRFIRKHPSKKKRSSKKLPSKKRSPIIDREELEEEQSVQDAKLRLEEMTSIEPIDIESRKQEIADRFIWETASDLDRFLPVVGKIKWHIVSATKVYDRPIGLQVLNALQRMRNDVRIYEEPEKKFRIQLPGAKYLRVVVPQKSLWFYENQTGGVQRLLNGLATRTFSDEPSLVAVGGPGVSCYIPSYKGMPVIGIPTCHKIDEQVSTENMVGCTLVEIVERKEKGKFRIIPQTYNFRPAFFKERDYILPKSMTGPYKEVLEALKPGSTSLTSIRFMVNNPQGKKERNWTLEKTRKHVEELVAKGYLSYDKRGNFYDFTESLTKQTPPITLESLEQGHQELTMVGKSCWHVGASKSLYHTVLRDEVDLAENADAIFSNGDLTQGVAHHAEYNGENLPSLNGPDKHEYLAAQMQADIIERVFERRYKKFKRQLVHTKKGGEKRGIPADDIIEKCLIPFYYKHGNHDEPRFSRSKNAVMLMVFDTKLRALLVQWVMEFLGKKGYRKMDISLVTKLVDTKIIRVGESRIAKLNGIEIGVKHPFQSRTKSKGTRIQETINFFGNVLIVWVANFHEHTTLGISSWGKVRVGFMTGSQLADSSFESNQNKVVEHGLAKATVCLDASKQILWYSVEYSTEIAKEDSFVLLEHPTNKDISEHESELYKKFNMPWR